MRDEKRDFELNTRGIFGGRRFIGSDAAPLPVVRAHWRAGTDGNSDIIEGFPAANLAPDGPTFADAAALCDRAKDPPVGNPAIDRRP